MEAAKKQSQFKAKQSQFVRIACCVMFIAKRSLKKQSQFTNHVSVASALEGKYRFARKIHTQRPVFCIFLEKFNNSILKSLGICGTDATIAGRFVDKQKEYFDLRIRNKEYYAHYKSVS